jgi:hypothetical protein
MVFSSTIFDHTRFLDGFDKQENIVVVRDDLMFELAMEEQASWIIFTLENYLVNKVTSQGYSIEFSQAGRQYTVTDPHQNRIMYIYWEEEIKKMLRHMLRYGFCAIRYTEVKNSKDPDRFVPRCMDPVWEYSVRFRINEDGSRDYVAYERSKVIQDGSIPNSRVFVAFEPESDGTLNSPLQKCFSEVQRLRAYWERNEQQDFRNSNPIFMYEVENKKDGIIPAGMPEEVVAEHEANRQGTPGYGPVTKQQLDVMWGQEIGDKFMQQQFNKETVNGLPPNDMYRKVFNPVLRRFTDVPMPDPFRPEKLLKQNQRLAKGVPQPKPLVGFDKVIESLARSIANCYGVPSEVIESGRGQFSANVQFSTQQLNITVQSYQRILERFIVQMYLDIYVDDHLQLLSSVISQINSRRIENTKGGEKKTKKKSDSESRNESTEKVPEKKKRKLSDLILSDKDRLELERSVLIEVHFNVNPSFDFQTLKMYKDEMIISHENYQKIALSMAGLPQSMAMSAEQIEQEAHQEAKRQKILNPEPVQKPTAPQAASTKPEKKPSKSEGKKSDSQAKEKSGKDK